MDNIFEITIIGRGGQGAKTASEVLATAALGLGKHIQAFSEYGAERAGAPILSYIRISDGPITLHTSIIEPDIIIVMDDSLVHMANLTHGKLLVNTLMTPAEIRKQTGLTGGKICTFDGTGISIAILGANVPNTASLGAFARATDIIQKDAIIKEFRNHLEKKIGKQVMDRNIECLEKVYHEVREE